MSRPKALTEIPLFIQFFPLIALKCVPNLFSIKMGHATQLFMNLSSLLFKNLNDTFIYLFKFLYSTKRIANTYPMYTPFN